MSTQTEPIFINDTQPVDISKLTFKHSGSYGYRRPSKYLFLWSRLLQSVVSQAGTYLLTGHFHNSQCAIYKSEGGARIDGVGELVLSRDSCYFDGYPTDERAKKEKPLAELITHVVLTWNPMDPVDSMLTAAAEFLALSCPKKWTSKEYDRKCNGYKTTITENPNWTVEEYQAALRKAIEAGHEGGPFGGNALADFFDWNPFSKAPIDREYQRWCYVRYNGMTHEEVDQQYADEDLGDSLKKRVNDAIKKVHGERFYSYAMCCVPKRDEKGLRFWVNTGRSTQIDGWKTQEDLERFINSGEKLNDNAKY